ncbi:MAG TPA: phospholipase D-like domain-containing protein [Nitrospirota bacterium]|nr:phospholipase D-like domain-containing protein [Nitrospirota bacterium]
MTSVRLLKNGIEAFPAMFTAIDHASKFIALEMYIFADNETGREFRDHLINAARRGVRVRVLIDSWGSWNLPDTFWHGLRTAGGMVRWFHPLSKGLFSFRNHRKLLFIDDQIAYLGGINISDEYYRGADDERPWRDNALEIIGPEVARLRGSFLRMWGMADTTLARLLFRLRRDRKKTKSADAVRFMESGPENMMRPVRRAYRQVIHNAKHSIDLAMGYFYPHGRMLRALKRAVRRGVRVRLMLPLHTDLPITRWAAHGLYGRLLRAGVEIWEYTPAMMHAKLAVADDTVIAGSANLDVRSGRINYELVAIITDQGLAEKARADFEDDLKQSIRILIEDWQSRSLFQKVKEWLSYCLLARFDIIVARFEMSRRMR